MKARDNPFASAHVERLAYRFLHGTFEDLMTRLEACRFRGEIVGPHGSGKTTLLEQLAPWIEHRGFQPRLFRLCEASRASDKWRLLRRLRLLARSEVPLIDGAEQLSLPQWIILRIILRRAGGLVITAHSPGRLPLLWRCETTPGLLRDLVNELHSASTIAPAKPELATLWQRHRGNIRDALRELYDHCSLTSAGWQRLHAGHPPAECE